MPVSGGAVGEGWVSAVRFFRRLTGPGRTGSCHLGNTRVRQNGRKGPYGAGVSEVPVERDGYEA